MRKLITLLITLLIMFTASFGRAQGQEGVSYVAMVATDAFYQSTNMTTVCAYIAKWLKDKSSEDPIDQQDIDEVKQMWVNDLIYRVDAPATVWWFCMVPLSDLVGSTKDGLEPALTPETIKAIETKIKVKVGINARIIKEKNLDAVLTRFGFAYRKKQWEP